MTSSTNIDRTGEEAPASGDLPDSLDRINLEQALLDFEIANARVIDLTRRLVEASDELNRIRHEVEILRPDAEAARGSRLFMTARRVRKLIQYITR